MLKGNESYLIDFQCKLTFFSMYAFCNAGQKPIFMGESFKFSKS